MSEIPNDWSLAALLLFGGAVTALAAGAAILLAESWFQKMRQRREHFKIGKTGGSKSGKSSSANPFSGSI
jgi:hypothetical protein